MNKVTKSASNAEIHGLLHKAVLVFEDWPESYFSFLEWQRRNAGHKDLLPGLNKDFRTHSNTVYKQLRASAFDFLREAFEDYLHSRWDGGYVSRLRRTKRNPQRKQKFMSRQEARKVLNVSATTVDKFLREKRLKGLIRRKKKRRILLIDGTSVDNLKTLRERLVNKEEAMKQLGSNARQFALILRAKLLEPDIPTDARSPAGYRLHQIEELLRRAETSVPAKFAAKPGGSIRFNQAVLSLESRGVGFIQFLRAILDGGIQPCNTIAKNGLRGLNFYRQDVVRLARDVHRQRVTNAFTIREAAEDLGTCQSVISFLVLKKILPSRSKRIGGRRLVLIPHKEIANFTRKYVFTKTLAAEIGTSRRFLIDVLKRAGIQPVLDRPVDGGPTCIFRKSDIAKVDLPRLARCRQKKVIRERLKAKLVSLTAAIAQLKTDEKTLLNLVANGILTPDNSKQEDPAEDSYHFKQRQLNKLRGRIREYGGLISAAVAAQLCGTDLLTFKVRYFHTHRLSAVRLSGNSTPYFLRRDVEKLTDRTLLRIQEACSVLRISRTQLGRFVRQKTLKPISGPSIDGSGVNLFLRADVENLHQRRESFKHQRLLKGGSARFGSPTGARSAPVRSIIGPRIDELIASATKNGKRLTAPPLHRQLLKEGYTVGICSVYVYLRNSQIQTRIAAR
ncbi:MAG: hypothetical protein WAQ99_22315 [Pyrinomonadaceae bacterium]